MSHTITIRVPKEIALWLEETATRSGRSQGEIVRDALEVERRKTKRFLLLAGAVDGPKDLPKRKGFAKG